MKNTLIALALMVLSMPVISADHVPVKRGRWKVFQYETPDKTPIIFSGWSKAVDAFAQEYSIFLDVFYVDGTAAWGRKADFRLGTHDWEEAKGVFVPSKPVKKIEVYALFRSKAKGEKAKGAVKFRDFSIERREGKGETFSTFSVTDRPFSCTRTETKKVFKGREFEILTVNVPDTRPVVSPVPAGKTVVWTEDSMRLVTPLTFPSAEAKKDIRLALAKRERESAQILVSTATNMELCAVALELPVLRRKDGTALSGRVDWRRQGYLAREHGARKHPYSFPENERWFPDPLLPPAPMRVRPASTQGTWLTVYASPDAIPGEYRGTVVVRDAGKVLAKVPMSVTVYDFSLPETFGLETAYTLMDGFTRAIYPECFKEKKREAIDIMLDHRLNPDDISRTTPPEIEDLIYARSRGMNRFNILNIVPPPKNPDTRWVLTCSEKAIADPKFYDYFVSVVRPNGDDTYFPSYRTHNGNGMPGDGIMMYPGEKEIWPSIKLAQCRDGVEDYEYLQLAAAKAGVEASDKVTKTVVRTKTDFSRSPEELRKARELLSTIITNGR